MNMTCPLTQKARHSRAGGNPAFQNAFFVLPSWISACAGMTLLKGALG
jgi:hypothetical protein